MSSERGALGIWGMGRVVFVAVLVLAALTGCAGTAGRSGSASSGPEVVFRNLSGQVVWVYLERNEFGRLLGSVPALGRARLRIPAALARPGARVRLSVVKRVQLPDLTEIVTDVTLPIEDVRWMEWTLTGSTLSQASLRGVPLAGGGGRP